VTRGGPCPVRLLARSSPVEGGPRGRMRESPVVGCAHDGHPAQRGRARAAPRCRRVVARGGRRGVTHAHRRAQRRAQRLLGRARQRGTRAGPVPRARPGWRARAAVRRTGGDQGGARRRRLRHHLRRARQQHARRGRRRGRTPAPGGGCGDRREGPHAGVRRLALHRVGRLRLHAQPVADRLHPRRLQRWHRGGRGVRDGPDRDGWGRWRLDPDPGGVLRALRPQAAAGAGDDLTDGTPVVGRSAPSAR
jgi:hypothetical protein